MKSVHSSFIDCAYKAARDLANTLARHYYSIEGKESVPEKEPFVIWAHHSSSWDIIEDANITGRRVSFVVKSEYFKPRLNPIKLVFATMLRIGEEIRFDRSGMSMEETYAGLERALADGAGIVIYPSGTRSHLDYVGKAGPLVNRLAGNLIRLSEIYSPMHFIAVGRTESIIGGKRNVAVVCEEVAVAEKGKVMLYNAEVQGRFDAAYAQDTGKGLDVLVNEYVMPRIAALSRKEFKPDSRFYVRNELRKRRRKHRK